MKATRTPTASCRGGGNAPLHFPPPTPVEGHDRRGVWAALAAVALLFLVFPPRALAQTSPEELKKSLYDTQDEATRGIAASGLQRTPEGKALAREVLRQERKRADVLKALLKSLEAEPDVAFLDDLLAVYARIADEPVRAQAVGSLRALQRKAPVVHDRLLLRAADRTADSRLRVQAIGALGQMRAWQTMGRLIQMYSGPERPLLGKAILNALSDITHLDHGTDLAAWTALWKSVEGRSAEEVLSTFLDQLKRASESEKRTLEEEFKSYIDPADARQNLRALTSRLPGIREHAVTNLAAAGAKDAGPTFLRLLRQEKEARVLAALAAGIGKTQDPQVAREAGPALVAMAESVRTASNPHSYSAAEKLLVFAPVARALGALRHAGGLDLLEELLRWEGATEELKIECHRALGQVGGPRALATLTRRLAGAESEKVLESVAEALGGFPEASDVLASALQHPQAGVRWYAADSLGKIGPKLKEPERTRAVQALSGSLSESTPRVRNAVVGALGEIGHPLALPGLARALAQDKDALVRRTAGEALAKLALDKGSPGLQHAVGALEQALSDPVDDVKGAAWKGILSVLDKDLAAQEALATKWYEAGLYPHHTHQILDRLLAATVGKLPDDAKRRFELRRRMARCHFQLDQLDKARPLYEALLKEAPKDRQITYELAVLLAKSKAAPDRTQAGGLLASGLFAEKPADHVDWRAALLRVELSSEREPQSALARLAELEQLDANLGGLKKEGAALRRAIQEREKRPPGKSDEGRGKPPPKKEEAGKGKAPGE